MGPVASISDSVAKVFRFTGRTGRAQYWWTLCFGFALIVVAQSLAIPSLETDDGAVDMNAQAYALFILPMFLFNLIMLSATARRFQDHGWHGGWFKIAALINIAGGGAALGLLMINATRAPEDAVQFPLTFLFSIPAISVFACAWIGFVKAEPGANRYGPNPHEVTS